MSDEEVRIAEGDERARHDARVALVTGGTRGIGRAVAERLAEDGFDVALGYMRDRDAAATALAAVRERGARAVTLKGQLGDPAKLDRVAAEFERWSAGRLDVLVHSAASGILVEAAELTAKHWDWTLGINARALLLLAGRLRGSMREGGRIVALSSLGAQRVLPNYAAVAASKAALESVVRYLAVEYAPLGVTANAVSASVVDTDALRHFPNREQMLDWSLQRTPAGRLVTPGDLAEAVRFLCSEQAEMIRGQTLVVDGGYSLLA